MGHSIFHTSDDLHHQFSHVIVTSFNLPNPYFTLIISSALSLLVILIHSPWIVISRWSTTPSFFADQFRSFTLSIHLCSPKHNHPSLYICNKTILWWPTPSYWLLSIFLNVLVLWINTIVMNQIFFNKPIFILFFYFWLCTSNNIVLMVFCDQLNTTLICRSTTADTPFSFPWLDSFLLFIQPSFALCPGKRSLVFLMISI